jgi:murein DD-endopeptidase MepM/ murein hydrolase activator NlpD
MRKLVMFAAAVFLATAAGAVLGTALTPVAPPRAPNVRGPGPVSTPPLQKLVVTSPYGPRVVRGKFGVHRGIDLRARIGTPLAAVGSGVVSKTHRTKKGGLSVVVQLDDGWRAGYAHMSRVDVAAGARIHAGARIGLSGDTGTEGAPHLHFELRDPKSKALVDPWPHLARHAPRSRLDRALTFIHETNVRDAHVATRLADVRVVAERSAAQLARDGRVLAAHGARTAAAAERTLARSDMARTLARRLL